MKKNFNKAFSKILSVTLVMALMLTSILSAGFTASAETTAIANKNVTDFEEGAIPSTDSVSSADRFAVSSEVARGSYSLKAIGSDAGTLANYSLKGYDFTVGTTYIVGGMYYVENKGVDDYSWFSIWEGNSAEIKSFGGASAGAWNSFVMEYTCSIEDAFLKFNVAKSTINFDDIYIIEASHYDAENLPLITDFSNIETVDALPVFANTGSNTVHYEYNEELGKNVAVGTIGATSSNFAKRFYIPYKLKANTTYDLTVTYKTDAWMASSVDGTINGSYAYDTGSWRTETFTHTATADGQMFALYSQAAGTIYFSQIILKETATVNTNTADKQVYDFDAVEFSEYPTKAFSTTIVTGADNNGTIAANFSTSSKAEMNAKLDYPLVQGEYYKISFKYMGSGNVMGYANDGGWGSAYNSYGIATSPAGNAFDVYSEEWATYSQVFTATYASTHFWFYNVQTGTTLYIDDITIEKLDMSADKQVYDFDSMSFAAGNPTTATLDGNVVADLSVAEDAGWTEANVKLIYPLTKGNVYKLSYDYKGSGGMRHIPNSGSWGNEMYSAEQSFDNGNNDLSLNSEDWATHTTVFTAEYASTNIFLRSGVAGSTLYLDNITIEDVTADYDAYNYIADFETEDQLVEGSGGVSIAYEDDADFGKVAKITYSKISFNDTHCVKLPVFRLMAGETYRIKFTYKSDTWFCGWFDGAAQAGVAGIGAPKTPVTEWEECYFTITATTTGTFGIGTNMVDPNRAEADRYGDSASLWIAELAVERVNTEAGDVNNDCSVNNTDLVLMKQWFIGAVTGYDIFTYNLSMDDYDEIDIRDLIRMKRTLAGVGAPVSVILDECSTDAELYSSAQNIYKNGGSEPLGDTSRYILNAVDTEGYIIYYAHNGLEEAAIQYDRGEETDWEMTVYTSVDQTEWTEISADTVSSEFNSNGWLIATNYYGDLSGKYLKIVFPNINSQFGLRKVYINGLDGAALSAIGAQNTELREAATIYVSNDGSDSNDGLTEATALATLDAAVSTALVPGDTIALACGDTFEGGAVLAASGTADAPITLTSYGSGEKPVITIPAGENALDVTGEYIEISNLAFTGKTGFSALDFYALEAGATKGLGVKNCEFYDINHTTAATSDDSGAIHFHAMCSDPAWFDGVTVANNSFDSVARTAVFAESEWIAIDRSQTWGNRNLSLYDGSPYLAQNFVVRGNTINNNGGDAIMLIGTQGARIEYNVVSNSKLLVELPEQSSFAAVWFHSSVDGIIQYNEVYGTTGTNGGTDLWAFDIDHACTGCIVQYNYSHENEGGMVIVCGTDGENNSMVQNTTVRYNISVNDGLGEDRSALDFSSGINNVLVHNNTIIAKETDRFFTIADYNNAEVGPTNIKFYNNLFYNANENANAITYGGDYAVADQITVEFYNNVFRNVNDLPWTHTNLWSNPVYNGNIEKDDTLLNGIADFINNTTITKGLTSVYNTCSPVDGSVLLTGGYDVSSITGFADYVAVDYTGTAFEGNLIGAIS
ncbi:MAG: hypothetical protein IKD04_01890 [Clostridia bacterium]|nr:hypothetical protein [Clostridia bacterium]